MIRVQAIRMGIVGILLFGTGWQTGRIMSPYYAATPVVFEDHQPAPGGEAQLQALLDNPSPSTSISPTQNQGKYLASKNSTLFHDPSCASAKSIKPENQVWFASVEAAKSAGYSPSACTQKLLGISQ
ncbi:MAG: hypothetical protein ABIP54_01620 [Candidatus Andersenbacteria bacterium]